jgi:hypothetical protein
MLEEVGYTVLITALVATTSFDPNSNRSRLKARHMFSDDLKAV